MTDPDPGVETEALLRLGFGEDKWVDYLVAEVGAEVVGFAAYSKHFEIHTRSRRPQLGDLVVTERCRNRRIGDALMAALRQKAVELGCDAIVLELCARNALARAFNRKIGAVQESELEVHQISADTGPDTWKLRSLCPRNGSPKPHSAENII